MWRETDIKKWFMTKRTALPCSLFVTVQWILLCALMHYRASWIYGAYIVLCGFFAVTLPFFVIFDGPLRANAIYQFALACTVWSTGVIITVEMVSAPSLLLITPWLLRRPSTPTGPH